MAPALGDKKQALPTRSERALVQSLLHDDFGDVAERVGGALLRSEGLRLVELAQKLRRATAPSATPPTLHEVCRCLGSIAARFCPCVLLTMRRICIDQALYRLRFPKFLEQAKEAFGLEGEVLMDEILVHGRIRLDQSLEAMAYSLAEQRRQQEKKEETAAGGEQAESEEIGEEELAECRRQLRETFVEMAKKRYISRVHPLDLTVVEPEALPEFPACITRGQENGSAAASSNLNSSSSATTAASEKAPGSTNAKTPDENGITVRGKKRKAPAPASGTAIPVELQMMLEADEAVQKEDDSEAEWEPSSSSTRGSAGSKRKSSKRAKLPTRGASSSAASAGDAATGGETSGEDATDGSTVGMDERSLVWRFGAAQLLRDLRHKACIKFASENINAVAGVIVAAMLQHSSPREREKDEPTSFPVSARELFAMESVKSALPPESNNPWRLLLNYIMVMCRDKSGMVMKVSQETFDPNQTRAGDGGQYVVHMQKIVEFLRQATTHAYVQDKFGVASARIVRLLVEKRQLEQKAIGELALLPSNDVRRRLYELFAEKLVKMQEVPKRADHNPALTFFCWSVDVPRMQARVAERIQDSVCRLRRRRKAEADENKELIARSELLVEGNDLDKFDKLSR
ncbi:hypothetical protein BBJ28_00026567, partial [Nothophytophthora sp. Chile5]